MLTNETKLGLKPEIPKAYKQEIHLFCSKLKRYCKLFLPDTQHIEDIKQEHFFVLWEKRQSIRLKQLVENVIIYGQKPLHERVEKVEIRIRNY